MTGPKVLVFDSGIGGLSVARCIAQTVPNVRLTYLMDNAYFPYGNQPESVVIERCVSLIDQCLQDTGADVVVIACNTASTIALPALRAAIPVPVVGVVPAIKPAAGISRNRRIGLLATPATVKRPYLDTLIAEFASDCTVTRIGQADLVHWIEAWASGQAELPAEQLSAALETFRAAEVDTVVLGCTHYPLIGELLRQLLPGVRYWVDSGEAIARRTRQLLTAAGFVMEEPDLRHNAGATVNGCFSGPAPAHISSYMAGLGMAPDVLTGFWPDRPRAAATAVASA